MATKSRYRKYVEGMPAVQNHRQNSTKKQAEKSVLQKLKKLKDQDSVASEQVETSEE